jgi:Calcineurin-like phosphoesterase
MDANSQAVVLSDIHIGNGAKTCWYQPTVHHDYLQAALEWIVSHRDAVREVILLGDVFDVWTYEPSVRPPTMSDIITHNLKLLGPAGPFAKLVKALPGRVRLLLGNHDGTLTPGDIATLNASLGGDVAKGEAINLVTCPVLVLRAGGADGTAVAFTHGHHWCMFNAPDEQSPWHTLPVGHLVSRAIAYRVARDLAKQNLPNAAELPLSGNPAGLGSFQSSILTLFTTGTSWFRKHIAEELLKAIGEWSHMPDTEPILLPGTATTTLREGKARFVDLYRRWADTKEGRGHDADRAAIADIHGADLAWFAQRVAFQTSSDLVVMGHTHKVVRGLKRSPVDYVNNGYACVAKPDMNTDAFTFTLVDIPRASAQLRKVVMVGDVPTVTPLAGSEAKPISVIQRGKDFSCYVRIKNRTSRALSFAGSPKHRGWWTVPPPQMIPSGARADIWVQDEYGATGSNATFSYQDGSATGAITFSVACPTTVFDNACSSTVRDFETKAGDHPWRTGATDPKGHPLQVRCTIGAVRAPGITAAAAPDPSELKCHASPDPKLKPTPRQQQAATQANYLDLARQILTACNVPAYRGKVLTDAWLIAKEGQTLIDPATEPIPNSRGGLRLKNPPQHVNPQVFQVNNDLYGPYEYVLILSNGATGGVPAFGGFLFLPAQGSPNLHLVSFNVVQLDDKFAAGCEHAHHAEMQTDAWIDHQDARWQQRLRNLRLTNSSRDLILPKHEKERRFLAYSACNYCCEALAVRLTTLNSLRAATDQVRAWIAWGDLYEQRQECGHPTTKSGIDWLRKAKWKIQGPLPAGMVKDEPQPDEPGWPPRSRSTR